MSNQDNLLSDEELDAHIRDIRENWDFSPFQDEDSRIIRVEREIKALVESQKRLYAESKFAGERMLVASEIISSVGALKIQASQAGDRWPPQTHEMINEAYEKATKYIKAYRPESEN